MKFPICKICQTHHSTSEPHALPMADEIQVFHSPIVSFTPGSLKKPRGRPRVTNPSKATIRKRRQRIRQQEQDRG